MGSIVLLRHAKALKNIEDRHGGSGTSLTKEGECQAIEVVKQLSCHNLRPNKIFSSPVPQAVETAAIIASKLKISVIEHSMLRPLNLGVLAGLSRNEAMAQFQDAANLMEDWRKGNIELHDLILPGAEDYRAFYKRGCDFLNLKIITEEGDSLVVGTRSILICLISILLGRTIESGGGYREIPMGCCDFFTFTKGMDKAVFKKSRSKCTDLNT